MKATILILLWAFWGVLLGFVNTQSNEDKEKKDIVLIKGNADDQTEDERSILYIPLTCYYMQGNVYLTTSTDLGEMHITITNLETVNSFESTYGSTIGTICIPVSSANGNYMISIAINNDSYYGYYTIY